MNQEAKPCPFCGSASFGYFDGFNSWRKCVNDNCGHSTPKCESRQEAISVWNKIADALELLRKQESLEPKQCPWCWDKTIITKIGAVWFASCTNPDCAATGPMAKTREDAIEKFNDLEPVKEATDG